MKARLTAFGNYFASVEEDPHKKAELISRIEKNKQLWTEFDTIQNKIENLDESEAQLTQRTSFEDSYHELISKARRLLPHNQNGSTIVNPVTSSVNPIMKPVVKLLNIDIPKFDGNYERWIPFRDLFKSPVASNTALSAIQKLHYLRSSLTGDAANIISALEITNDNYEIAWQLLEQRYENKRLIDNISFKP